MPEGVRDVLRTRLARLPDEAITVLTAGAIAGREFDVALVAHVCGIDEDRALDLVEAAWMTGIVDEAHDGLGHFRFSHELVREALVEGLTSLRRIRLHRRIGEAIEELHGERNPGFLTECAHHFAEAAPAGDALKAVLYGQRAADRLNAQLAYEDAIPTYERAIELVETYDVGSWQTRTDLLIGLGLGAPRDRPARRRAPRAAPRDGPAPAPKATRSASPGPCSASAAAASGAGGTSSASPTSTSLAYLERALEALDDEDSVLRCELLARLAVEGYFTTSRERRRALSAEALAMARRLDDPGRAHRRARVRAARELDAREPRAAARARRRARRRRGRELASRTASSSAATSGWSIGSSPGDRAAADADFAACEHLAERLGHYAFHVQLAWYRSMIAFIEGRLDDAERLTHDAFERNLLSNEPAAWTAYGVQMFRLRREQGRHVELEGVIRASAERQPHLALALYTGLATIAGEHGRTDEARAIARPRASPTDPFADGDDLMATLHAVHIAEAAVADRPRRGRERRRRRPRRARRRGRAARDGPPVLRCDRSRARRRRPHAGSPRRRDRVLRAGDRHRGSDRRADLRQPVAPRARDRARRARRATATGSAVEFLAPAVRAGGRGARHADGRRRGPGARP